MLVVRDPLPGRNLDPRLIQERAAHLPIVVPNRWQGQVDCRVGPFSSRSVAAHFAGRVVDFGAFDVFAGRIFARREGWFVEVRPDPAAG
jgi:hypothetical protein